jgi:glycosyltransferase involved in cell wall biosynthesis
MRAYRLLLITYHWPPFSGSGATRWTALVKYLRRAGHEVTVVTTSAFGSQPSDAANLVVRTRDLAAAGALRRLLRRPPLRVEDNDLSVAKPAPGVLTKVVVPDAYAISWVPFAAAAARRLVAQRDFDCLLTSSPPQSVHLVGLVLGGRRPAWITDLRDGWTYERLHPPFPTEAQNRLDRRLESAVARSADVMIGATPPITDDLRDRFGVAATTVRNAWDPELAEKAGAAKPPPLEGDRVNLVYTGSLGGVRGHDDRALFEALRAIACDGDPAERMLRLVIAGPITESERELFATPELSTVVRYVGSLPRPEALALQRRAAALLLITSNEPSVSTSKIYEYLAAGRPILALAGENEAARIVAETGTGITVPPDDVEAIREALATLASVGLEPFHNPRGLDAYRYPAPAEVLVEAIGRAVGERL